MICREIISVCLIVGLTTCMFFSVPDSLYAQTEDLEWTTPRTPWGDPDFQGLFKTPILGL